MTRQGSLLSLAACGLLMIAACAHSEPRGPEQPTGAGGSAGAEAAAKPAEGKGQAPQAPAASPPAASPPGAPAPAASAGTPATQAAAAAAATQSPFPAAERHPIPPGPRVLALPANGKPAIALELRFRTGAVDDPAGKAGLTQLAAHVMAEGGTRNLTAAQLTRALFPSAARVEVRVDKEQTGFRFLIPADQADALLPILTDLVAHPRWDPGEFERLRTAAVNQVSKRLRQEEDEALGKAALSERMYRGHPYGRLTAGHVAELQSVTLDELKAHAARVFTQDRLTVGLAGGYPEGLGQKLMGLLSELPAQGAPAVAIPEAKAEGRSFLLVEKNAGSTAMSLGFPWKLSHFDPDWAALSVARSIFGEHRQSSGRLYQRLREARGLNYGDYAYLEHFEQEGGQASAPQTGRARSQQDFTIWLRPVRNENRLFALRGALHELQKSLSSDPFTADEVERTKGFLAGYVLLFDQTDARKLGYALDDAFLGDEGFLARWRTQVAQVTPEQVNAAWRRWVDPAHLQIVLAGSGMDEVAAALRAGKPTPMQYQKDAQGNAVQKPAAQLAEDKVIEALPTGAESGAPVEVVPVEKLFESDAK